jgi:hypothetical protein
MVALLEIFQCRDDSKGCMGNMSEGRWRTGSYVYDLCVRTDVIDGTFEKALCVLFEYFGERHSQNY